MQLQMEGNNYNVKIVYSECKMNNETYEQFLKEVKAKICLDIEIFQKCRYDLSLFEKIYKSGDKKIS